MATTQERLDLYYAQEAKILGMGQAYTADGLQMARADLQAVRDAIKELEEKLKRETAAAAGIGRIYHGRPG